MGGNRLDANPSRPAGGNSSAATLQLWVACGVQGSTSNWTACFASSEANGSLRASAAAEKVKALNAAQITSLNGIAPKIHVQEIIDTERREKRRLDQQ